MHNAPVIIIGGGISGLSVAWFLHERGVPVRVWESRAHPGGTIATLREAGYLTERGPNSTMQKPGHPDDALGRLIRGVGLEARLQIANPAAERRYVLREGRLKPLPTSPLAFIFSSFFSWRAKGRLLLEPFIGRAQEEESIAAFVRRRLGDEFLDYVIEPFISGVYAGNPEALSVQAAVAKIYALEQRHGSLIRGALHQGRVMKGAGMPKGRLISFDHGMALLPQTVSERLPQGTVQTNLTVTAVTPTVEGSWLVEGMTPEGHKRRERASQVVLSVPAPVAADLIAPFADEAARALRTIPYAPIASVALGYRRAHVAHPLDGFGFLVPRREQVPLLGALFSSTLFPGRAKAGRVLVTAFIGGAMHPEWLALSDRALVGQVESDLARCIQHGVSAEYVRLTRYTAAIPQYTMGHLERVHQVEAGLASFPGMHMRANWRDGVSVADCVRHGEQLAEKMIALKPNPFQNLS